MWKDVLAQPDSVAINTTALEENFAQEGTMSKIPEVPQQRKSVVSICGCENYHSLLELFLPNLPNTKKVLFLLSRTFINDRFWSWIQHSPTFSI